MKFVFTKEVQKLIDDAAAMPLHVADVKDTRLLAKLEVDLGYRTAMERNARKISTLDWGRIISERHFFKKIMSMGTNIYCKNVTEELIDLVSKGEKFPALEIDNKNLIIYQIRVKLFRMIQNGELLKDKDVVLYGLEFGVIRLSGDELNTVMEIHKTKGETNVRKL